MVLVPLKWVMMMLIGCFTRWNVSETNFFKAVQLGIASEENVLHEIHLTKTLLADLQKKILSVDNFKDEAQDVLPFVPTLQRGRPKYDIKKEQLEFLLNLKFSTPEIAKCFGTSISTIKRRMNTFHCQKKTIYTELSDNEIDEIIESILKEFPRTGYRRMIGFLKAKNIIVHEKRGKEFNETC